eukprot:GCRY01002671.1.p1 GENE.GCRY01002671.1~~GCRY01002671.1.p1  ORF type:complete len:1001 (+),score=271.40 GCRY01002671.1:321-3323(+)
MSPTKTHSNLKKYDTGLSELTSTSGYTGSIVSLGTDYKARSKKRITRFILGGRIAVVLFFIVFVAFVSFISLWFSSNGSYHAAKDIGEKTISSLTDYIRDDLIAALNQIGRAMVTLKNSFISRDALAFDNFLHIQHFENEFYQAVQTIPQLKGCGYTMPPTPSAPYGGLVNVYENLIAHLNDSTMYVYGVYPNPYGMPVVVYDPPVMVVENTSATEHGLWAEASAILVDHPSFRQKPFFCEPGILFDELRMMGVLPVWDSGMPSPKGFLIGEVSLAFAVNFLSENISHFIEVNPDAFDLCILTKAGLIINCTCYGDHCDDSVQQMMALGNSTTSHVGKIYRKALAQLGGLDRLFVNADGSTHNIETQTDQLPAHTLDVYEVHDHIVHLRVFGEQFHTQMIIFVAFRTDTIMGDIQDSVTKSAIFTVVLTLVGVLCWGILAYVVSMPLSRQLHEDRRRQLRLMAERQRLKSRIAAQGQMGLEGGNDSMIDFSSDTPLSKALHALRSMYAVEPTQQLEEVINLLKRANNLQTVEWRQQLRDAMKQGGGAGASQGALASHRLGASSTRPSGKRVQIHDAETTKWLEETFTDGKAETDDESGLDTSTGLGHTFPQAVLSSMHAHFEIPGTPDIDLRGDYEEAECIKDPLEPWIMGGNEMIIRKLLSQWAELDFSVFRLDELTNHHSLAVLSVHLITLFGLHSTFSLNLPRLNSFLGKLEGMYRKNPYHNSMHAAEVLGLSVKIVNEGALCEHFSAIDFLSLLLAAIGHDVDHPGVNNAFLVTTTDPLAVRYNDSSVLENHHAATLFTLLNQPEYNFVEELPAQVKKDFRETVICCILGTDMTHHFELMGEFTTRMEEKPLEDNMLLDKEGKRMYSRVALKLADIGHTMKDIRLTVNWTERINNEFFAQGDRERSQGYPVSQFMDRHTMNIAKSQIGFLDFVVRPLVKAWCNAVNSFGPLRGLDYNREFWVKLHAREIGGVPSLAVTNEIAATLTTDHPSSSRRA